MGTFVRAVITGFGFSLGKMIFEKVKDKVEERYGRNRSEDDNGAGSVAESMVEE